MLPENIGVHIAFFCTHKYLHMHDLSKYTGPTGFVGIAVPTKVVEMLGLSALPKKVVGMQAGCQIKESKGSDLHLVDCQINFMKTLATEFLWNRRV